MWVLDTYHYFNNELADKRTNDWFLVEDPITPGLLLIFYWLFVKKLGPSFMKNREAYDLRYPLVLHNLFQIGASIFLFVSGLYAIYNVDYDWICAPLTCPTTPAAMRLVNLMYHYYIVKLTELIDTIFFVLRKKNDQASGLHMFHHTIMPIVSWYNVKYVPGNNFAILPLYNSFVHIIMYTYYLFNSFGPDHQGYRWWKKYVTIFQILQFMFGFSWCVHNLAFCYQPKTPTFIGMLNVGFQLYLFMKLYYVTYTLKPQKEKMKKDK